MDPNITHTYLPGAAIPENLRAKRAKRVTEKMAIKASVKTLNGADLSKLRIVRIQDTLHMEKIWISEALLDEAAKNRDVEIWSEAVPLVFDEDGNLF